MGGYEYTNDYEREHTQKYEGIYTPEEIELNKKLYEERKCCLLCHCCGKRYDEDQGV